MSAHKSENKSFLYRLSTFIVDKRSLFFLFYILAGIFSVFSFGWVEATGTYSVSVDGSEPIRLQNTVKGLGWRDWVDSSEAQVSLIAG